MIIAAMDCRRNGTTHRGRRERWTATTSTTMLMIIIICGSLHIAFQVLDWQRTVTAFSTLTTCSDGRRITMMHTTTGSRVPPHSSRPDASSSLLSRHNIPKFRSRSVFANQLHIPHSDSSMSNVEHGAINPTIQYVPSMIVFQNVSHCYPRHNNNPNQIIRQLFSSIPDRLYAILQISFTISSSSLLSVENDIPPIPLNNNHQSICHGGFVLLTGASSSGKSTMLQLIAHCSSSSSSIPPTHGSITIRTTVQNIDDHHLVALPILLDTISISQYRLPYETRRTISDVLNDDIMSLMSPTDSTKNEPSRSTTLLPLMRAVVTDLVDRVELFPTMTEPNHHASALMETMSPSQLSTSQQYKLGIIRACLCSSGSGGRIESRPNDEFRFVLPGPILLLDECFDKETTATIRGIQSILMKLCNQMGAIVIVTTHVPQRWNPSPCVMTFCRGEILTTTTT